MKKLFLLFLFPTLVFAEPGPTTQYLMNEPASLFDVGMVRLRFLIHRWEDQMTGNYRYKAQSDKARGGVQAQYRHEDDKIYVSISMRDDLATEDQMEAGCRYALQHIAIYVSKSVPSLFRHAGNADPNEFKRLRDPLVEMFELRCSVSDNHSNGRFWATKRLGEEDMTIGKWKMFN